MIWYSSRYAFQAWYLKVNRTVPQIAKIASFSQIIICVCIELQQQHHHQRFNQNQPIYLLSVFVCFMQFLPSRPMRLPRRFFYFISKMHRCENVRKVLFGEKEKIERSSTSSCCFCCLCFIPTSTLLLSSIQLNSHFNF